MFHHYNDILYLINKNNHPILQRSDLNLIFSPLKFQLNEFL